MKILQINSVYNEGSTGKIVYDIHKCLQIQDFESIVCYGRGQKVNEANVYKTSSELFSKFNALRARITGLQYNGSWLATIKLTNIIKKEKPDIVHIHCLNGYFVNIYKLLGFLKNNRIRTVLTLHAEFMHTGSCGHSFECTKWINGCGDCPQLWVATKSYLFDRTHTAWVLMKKSFDNFDSLSKICAVSGWLENRARQSPILKQYSFEVVHNGIDTEETFRPTDYIFLRDKYNLKDEKILLHVTANFSLNENDIKGGKYIIDLAERIINKNIKIFIVGSRDLKMVLPTNIINVGRTKNQKELAAYYSMADLTIIASKRETFSMVCVESLACGTPVVGFKAGAPETVALQDFSEFVEYGDCDALENTVLNWIGKKLSINPEVISNKAKINYSKNKMVSNYTKIYEQLNQNLT